MQDACTHNINDAFWVAAGTSVLGVNGELAHVSEGLVSGCRDGTKAARIWEIQGSLLSSHVNVDHAIWGGRRKNGGGAIKKQPRIPSPLLSHGSISKAQVPSTLELDRMQLMGKSLPIDSKKRLAQDPTVAASTVWDSNYLQESRMSYSQPPHTAICGSSPQ